MILIFYLDLYPPYVLFVALLPLCSSRVISQNEMFVSGPLYWMRRGVFNASRVGGWTVYDLPWCFGGEWGV